MNKNFLLGLLLSVQLLLFSQENQITPFDETINTSESPDLLGWNISLPIKKRTQNNCDQPVDAKTNQPTACCETPCSPPKPACPESLCNSLSSHLQFGVNYTYAHVKPSGQPSTSGSLGGLQALYEFQTPNRIYGGLAFAWRQGDTDGSGTSRSIQEFDTQERIGYSWAWCDACTRDIQWMLSLFSGFGYRHYGEKVSSGGSSITCNYNEFYFPVGFLLNGRINSLLSMGLNFQWMPQVYSTVGLVPLKGARWDLNNELANFRVELPFTFTVSKCYNLALVFQPYFEYWKDGHTSATTLTGLALDIPGNTYLFGGADLNLRYSF